MVDEIVPRGDGPLVSAIVPSFNQARYVRAAIESALAQTHAQLEVVVCDDGSTDDSIDEVRSIIAEHPDRRIELLQNETNRGVSFTRNRAIGAARGEHFAFLDADDLWEPGKIAAQVAVFEQRPEVGLTFTGAQPFADDATLDWLRTTAGLSVTGIAHWAKNDNALFRRRPRDRWEYLDRFLAASYVCWSSVMTRRRVAEAIGGFDERLSFQSEDWLFVLSSLLLGDIQGIEDRLTRYRLHPASYTCSVLIQDQHTDEVERRMRRELRRALLRFYRQRGFRRASAADRLGLARFAAARMGRGLRGKARAGLQRLLPTALTRGLRHRIHPPPELELLVLFVTSACNLSCEFCFYADNLNTRNDLHLDKMLRLIDSSPRAAVIELGGGEPFINRDLDQIMLHCLERADLLSINTNATLTAQVERTLRSVLEQKGPGSGELQVSVSIDGLEDTHDKVRGGRSFQTILVTLRMLHELRAEVGGFTLHVNTTMTATNYLEVPDLMDLMLAQFDLDYHNVEIERANPSSPEGIQLDADTLQAAYDAVLERLRVGYPAAYEESRARFSIQFLNRTQGSPWPFPCTAGRDSLVVYEDGRFATCEVLDVAGHVGDYDYDLRKALASGPIRERVEEIAKGECFCTHGCWLISSQISHGRPGQLDLEAINPGVLNGPSKLAASPAGR